ncbi:diol dehydratase reactivase subunit alpha [Halalkalicoccus subterraneus]|uniref:diol dehydratase reactivase subunit alpha n=1 Tax=Halalkalicoccus subterraneus TaxID=2675002 RepID=UPI000EFAC6DF|nr:diol dehydratase reactivase subunit alpha [Halalkalicoccus subterraneus]
MEYIAGVDIGNSSTEVALVRNNDGYEFVATSLFRTTGLKGTVKNVPGVVNALERAAETAGISVDEIDRILLNEAAPVIGDVAMETITETVITESTMIGHDPSTPGGAGLGTGTVVEITTDRDTLTDEPSVIVVVPATVDFADAAGTINEWVEQGIDIQGAIVQKDDAVLINNRIDREIPIVDEVGKIEEIPRGQPAAVEVATGGSGQTIDQLSNPYGLATLFELSSEETQKIIPVSRALVGNKSAVVIKTPAGDVEERTIPAGSLTVIGEGGNSVSIDIDQGADEIMAHVEEHWPIADIRGERGSNIGGMLSRAREQMGEVTGQELSEINIRDIMAVDTLVPQKVEGSVASEHSMETAVGLAAMVKTSELPMQQIADEVEDRLETAVTIQGIEANMAILGSLTTPGTDVPFAILDMGGGSTDAAYINETNEITSTHLAGAGDMVTMLIASELGVDRELAEGLKKYPVAKVETLFSIRHEDGTVTFLDEAVDSETFGRVVLLKDDGSLEPVGLDESVETVRRTRRQAKEKVFVTNAKRALRRISPTESTRYHSFVVMVGRSALDFEIPEMISDALAEYGIVCGRGNIRSTTGPRNAVATGLCLSYVGDRTEFDVTVPDGLAKSVGTTEIVGDSRS